MKRKPSTAPAVDSPWAISILPSTSKRPRTDAVPATTNAADTLPPPPAPPASPPVQVPASLQAPAWSPPAVTPSPSFVSAPHLGAGRQFGADTFGASSQYGPPAQFAPPPQYAPPAQFEPPAQFGGPPQPYAYPPAPARSGRSIAGIVGGILGGVLVIGVLAAIAIPVFVSQRNRPANRTVVVPTTLLRMPQIHSAELDDATAQSISAMSSSGAPWGKVTSGYFGEGNLPVYFVAAAKVTTRPTPSDETSFLRGAGNGGGITLMNVAPGPYGGKMQCGAAKAISGVTATECYAIDDAGVFAIVVFEASPSQAAVVARQIIAAVEH